MAWQLATSINTTLTAKIAPPVPGLTIVGTNADDADATTLFGTEGDDVIYGLGGNDRIVGGAGNDRLEGDDGDDELLGEAGNDTLNGGNGVDKMSGGTGADTLKGGAGLDFLYGDDGNDILDGGDDPDLLRGGTGNDRLYGGEANDLLFGEDGDDHLDGGNSGDQLDGGAGRDTLLAGEGNDYLNGGAGKDRLTGGAGSDSFRFTDISGSAADFDVITDYDPIGSYGSATNPSDVIDLSAILDKFTDFAGTTALEAIQQGYIYTVQHGTAGTSGFGTYVVIDRNGLASDGPVYGADITVCDLQGIAQYHLGYQNFHENFLV
jgi:Ca2+-binding RTX toxin-like protein